MILQSAGDEKHVGYADVTRVRLRHAQGRYLMLITFKDSETLEISNKYYLTDTEPEDRSRQYGAFVRLLHFHLSQKGNTAFSSGQGSGIIILWTIVAAFTACFLSFVGEFTGIGSGYLFAQTVALTVVIAGSIMMINWKRFSKPYEASSIPTQFIPDA